MRIQGLAISVDGSLLRVLELRTQAAVATAALRVTGALRLFAHFLATTSAAGSGAAIATALALLRFVHDGLQVGFGEITPSNLRVPHDTCLNEAAVQVEKSASARNRPRTS